MVAPTARVWNSGQINANSSRAKINDIAFANALRDDVAQPTLDLDLLTRRSRSRSPKTVILSAIDTDIAAVLAATCLLECWGVLGELRCELAIKNVINQYLISLARVLLHKKLLSSSLEAQSRL